MKLKLKESQTRVKKDQARIGFVDSKLVFTASAISHSSSICFVSSLWLAKSKCTNIGIPNSTESNIKTNNNFVAPPSQSASILFMKKMNLILVNFSAAGAPELTICVLVFVSV